MTEFACPPEYLTRSGYMKNKSVKQLASLPVEVKVLHHLISSLHIRRDITINILDQSSPDSLPEALVYFLNFEVKMHGIDGRSTVNMKGQLPIRVEKYDVIVNASNHAKVPLYIDIVENGRVYSFVIDPHQNANYSKEIFSLISPLVVDEMIRQVLHQQLTKSLWGPS